ncbi:MAG: alpha-amylase family protein [Oculatellaceae cyanobacterium Prado106]|jgi:alpha-amylase|nr:alpha-amylase family protein [Oculatellaceae cyanobacterium Prado106]
MIHRRFRQILVSFLGTVLLILIGNAFRAPLQASLPPAPAQDAVPFVHLFEWKWTDVALECENFLGQQGYGAVQISPPNEHVLVPEMEYPWWQRYQPVSYQIESRSGTRAEFADMVSRCHAAGVKIYADAVINHMAGRSQGVGIAGTPFTKYNYPGLYTARDFHPCKENIQDYGDRHQVTHCELVGLADLDTHSAYVQNRIADYLADLVSLGVDGFRIDAAKHIASGDLAEILNRVAEKIGSRPYVYQEVIDPGYEAIRKSEYYDNGKVIEFEYGRLVAEAFTGVEGKTLAQLETLAENPALMPNEKAIVFIDNHDKQRGHAGGGTYLTYKSGALYDLANIFMLAYPYGKPQVMSSFDFTSSDQGPPSNQLGQTNDIYHNGQANCFKEWICEHRRVAIASMVNFRSQLTAEDTLNHWWSNGNQIAFGRGQVGFVVLNRSETALTQTFQTSLPPGEYCNIITAALTENLQDCTVAQDTVAQDTVAQDKIQVNAQGEFTATVPPLTAIALHQSAKITLTRCGSLPTLASLAKVPKRDRQLQTQLSHPIACNH